MSCPVHSHTDVVRPPDGTERKQHNPFRVGSDPKRRRHEWKAMQAERAPFVGPYSRKAFDARQRITGLAVEAIKETRLPMMAGGSVTDRLRRDGAAITRSYLEEVHRRVGMRFAERSFQSIRGEQAWSGALQRKQVEDSWFQSVADWLQGPQGGAEIRQITETTRTDILSILTEGVQDGDGIETIARTVSEQMEGINRQRARVIARTEIITASNRGSLHGAKRTTEGLVKEWLDSNDSRVRRTHQAADGQQVDMDGSFNVNGSPAQYPGDPSLPARERIQCRCTIVYELKDSL